MLLATQFRLGCVCIDWQRPKSNTCACTRILPLSLLWDFTVCADWLPGDMPALILKVHRSLLLLLKNLVKATSPTLIPYSRGHLWFLFRYFHTSDAMVSAPGCSDLHRWLDSSHLSSSCLHFAVRFWKLLRQPRTQPGRAPWLIGRKAYGPIWNRTLPNLFWSSQTWNEASQNGPGHLTVGHAKLDRINPANTNRKCLLK